jgi:hypothetical protein
MDHVLPSPACDSQGPLDISERLGDLIGDGVGEFPVIVPAALPGDLKPVPDFYRLRIMEVFALALTVTGCDEKFWFADGIS